MLVIRPISPTSACATNPVTKASSIAHIEITTTRRSSALRSIGTRADCSAAPSDGATGTPSVVAPASNSVTAAPLIFKKHRRSFGAPIHGVDDRDEVIGELPPIGLAHPLQQIDQLLLRHARSLADRRTPRARRLDHQPPRVLLGAPALQQPRVAQTGDDDGDRALIGARPLGELFEREPRRLRHLVQDEELCTGEAALIPRGLIGEAEQENEAPDGVENPLAVGHRRTPQLLGTPSNSRRSRSTPIHRPSSLVSRAILPGVERAIVRRTRRTKHCQEIRSAGAGLPGLGAAQDPDSFPERPGGNTPLRSRPEDRSRRAARFPAGHREPPAHHEGTAHDAGGVRLPADTVLPRGAHRDEARAGKEAAVRARGEDLPHDLQRALAVHRAAEKPARSRLLLAARQDRSGWHRGKRRAAARLPLRLSRAAEKGSRALTRRW